MRNFVISAVILGLCAFVLTSTIPETAPPKCPVPDPEQGVVLLPNPDDCCTFYSCNGETPILLPCLNETWFNPEANVCDWPSNIPDGNCVPPPTGRCQEDETTTGVPPTTAAKPSRF